MTLNVFIFPPQSPEDQAYRCAPPLGLCNAGAWTQCCTCLKSTLTSWSTPQEIYCLLKARHSKILSVFTPMTALLKISNTVFICRSYNSLHRIMFQQSFTKSFGFPKPLVFTWSLLVFSEELKTEQPKNIKINEPCIFSR